MTGDDLKKQLAKDSDKQTAKLDEINKIVKLTAEFPDLKKNTDRWRKEFYSSKLANNKVTHCTIYHGCGCCNDSPLYVSPSFTHESGIEIYAEPYRLCIGEKNYGDGERPDEKWREHLTENQYPQTIIDHVDGYFKTHASSYYGDDSDV